MKLVRIDASLVKQTAPLVAEFRTTLLSYKGISSEPDLAGGTEELLEFLGLNYPVFAAEEDGTPVGYLVCRVEGDVLWVEHIYVRPDARRKGAASLLFEKAEELAHSLGGSTVFNYVHPNNDGMIGFLRAKGYTVLNLIEIRKPYPEETLHTTIPVGRHIFDY